MSANKEYKTKQRALILTYLKENYHKHITVDNIVDYFKKEGKPVGKTTVYRYLEKLIEQGCVYKYIDELEKSAFFQYVNEEGNNFPHHHLKCSTCGVLFHVECSFLNKIYNHLSDNHNFYIDNQKTVIYGHCEQCAKSL